jgi:2-dehydropantoate 2-reductase
MNILVFGTGGVGGYFGGRLAEAGHDVTFIARGPHLAAIREHGLRVESIAGDFTIHPAKATDTPTEAGIPDVVLLGVKAWDVTAAAKTLQPVIGPHTFVVPLQNGVTTPDELAAVLGREHILGGLCRISALVGEPGVIRHVGVEPYIAFAELDGQQTERVEQLRIAFSACKGLTVEIPADIQVALWSKFLFIASISGLGAVTRQPVGVFRATPESRALLVATLEETAAVARALGIQLPDDAVQKTLALIDNTAPGVTASMQRDIMQGKPSELESQNGAIARLGRELGVPTPTHAFIYACLRPGELQARNLFQNFAK